MKYQLVLIFALYCFHSCSEARKIDHHAHASLQAKRAVGDATTTTTESPADTLMRLKLLTYEEKLKAKEAKKKAKAEKKAAKEKAFANYLSAMVLPPAAPGAAGATATPAAAAAVPPMPMIPAIGLWKKSFLLSQIAAAIAASATTTTTVGPTDTDTETTTTVPTTSSEEAEEDATINEIVKRYAPVLRKKFYGSGKPYAKYYSNNEAEENESNEADDDETPEQYKSGAYNKFGTGPAGSPNGVGYDQGKINQAGCSGSHIHICSGTTVYLTNPDDDSVQRLEIAGELGQDNKDEDEQTVSGTEEVEQEPKAKSDNEKQQNSEKAKHGQAKKKHSHARYH